VAWRRNMEDMSILAPGCKIVYVEGAGHHLANESGELRARYLPEIDVYLKDSLS
jgi:hypothetical protein